MTVGERNQIIFLLNSHCFSTRGRRYCSRTFDKVLPHNFNELIDASIKILKGNHDLSDFMTQGIADISNYNNARRPCACACKNCTTRQKIL
jgi:hypothetical protein